MGVHFTDSPSVHLSVTRSQKHLLCFLRRVPSWRAPRESSSGRSEAAAHARRVRSGQTAGTVGSISLKQPDRAPRPALTGTPAKPEPRHRLHSHRLPRKPARERPSHTRLTFPNRSHNLAKVSRAGVQAGQGTCKYGIWEGRSTLSKLKNQCLFMGRHWFLRTRAPVVTIYFYLTC